MIYWDSRMQGAVLLSCSGGLFGGFGARRGACETWLLMAVMGLRRRKCSFAKVRDFGGSDVLPGTRVDGFTWDSRVRCRKTRQK